MIELDHESFPRLVIEVGDPEGVANDIWRPLAAVSRERRYGLTAEETTGINLTRSAGGPGELHEVLSPA